jgi:PDZ domain-containing secreted protein
LFDSDSITHVNGKQLGDPESFAQLVRSFKVGDKETLSLYRERKKRRVELILVERSILPGDLRSGGQGMPSPMHSRGIARSALA